MAADGRGVAVVAGDASPNHYKKGRPNPNSNRYPYTVGSCSVVGHALQVGLGDDGDAARCRFFDVADGHVCQDVYLARLDGDDCIVFSDFGDGLIQALGRQAIGDIARRLQGDDAFAAQGQVAR